MKRNSMHRLVHRCWWSAANDGVVAYDDRGVQAEVAQEVVHCPLVVALRLKQVEAAVERRIL